MFLGRFYLLMFSWQKEFSQKSSLRLKECAVKIIKGAQYLQFDLFLYKLFLLPFHFFMIYTVIKFRKNICLCDQKRITPFNTNEQNLEKRGFDINSIPYTEMTNSLEKIINRENNITANFQYKELSPQLMPNYND